MSELSKNQLTQENNNSFPNNNTGYITPTLLRTFNQNMIDSLVDEIQYNVDSASFNARINVLDPSGSAAAILSLQQATASLNAYTASQNSFNSSATASIVALQNFSSSLDTTYATDAQLSASVSALSSSVTVTTNGLSSSIGALQQFSSSLDTTFATDAQLSASASTLQNNINTLSSSVAVTTLGLSSSVAALQQFSSSLDSTFATDTQLSASASTLQNNINAKLDSASFNSYTQSNDSKVNSLIAATGSYAISSSVAAALANKVDNATFSSFQSYTNTSIVNLGNAISASATTGSNTFIGNQIVSGNVNIAGNITAISASFTYITTVFETASVIFSSGSNQLGDELIDVQTLSGSVKVEGTLTVNGVPVQTSSFDASGYLLTSSFNTYTQSAASGVSASINTATQSLSSSIAVTTNNLDLEVNQKLDTGSFNTYTQSNDIKVNALIAATGSYAISSSVANTFDAFSSSISLTYATETELSASASTLQNGINSKVENSTFNTYTSSQATINQGLQTGITIRLLTSSFNTYTSSNDGKVNSLIAATGSYITSAQTSSMTVLSSSFAQTASFALNVTPTDVTPFLSKSIFDAYTGSAALGVSASINSATQSLSSSIAVTTNNLDLEVNGKLDSSSFNTYTQSNDSIVNGKLDSASFNSYTQSNNSVVNALVAATSSYVTEAETGSFITSAQTSSMSVLSSSYSVTASFALNVTPTDVSPFLSASTFNAYTQSNDGKVNSLIEKTGSYATTGSNTFKNNQIISGNLDVTGKITALSASITYLETIFETASVIYSSGSNQFGDASDDTQTLFGKVDIKTGPLVITGSTFVSGNITMVNGTDLITHHLKAPSVNGVEIQTNTGGVVALFGAGGSLGTTFYGQINTTAISSSGNITGNLVGTASFANKALTASFAENVIPTDVSMFVSQSTFNTYTSSINSYTASNDSKVNSLIAATASYVTSAQTSSMSVLSSSYAVTASFALNATADRNGLITTGSSAGTQAITGSLIISGASFNAKVSESALSVGVTTLDTLFESTASGVVSQIDLTRQGAGPTGDLTAVRLQTLSGSDTSGDTLLSRITTGVNRHTSTAMTGSVVNTTITSTWATGSGGTRVAYGTTINANAQSQSATLSLIAGNSSLNNVGGTASIAAGLIRIGTNVAHTISTTGSFGPITIVGPNNGNALMIRSGSVEITSPQGSGSFYTNLPITSSHARFNGQSFIKRLNIEDNGGAADLQVENNVSITGSLTVGGGTGQIYGSASYAAFALLAGSSSFATNANTATSASFAQTASFALNTTTNVSMFLSKSVFDTYTGSAALGVSASINAATQSLSSSLTTTINGLSDKTGSYAITGSNIFKGVQIISSSVRGEQYVGSVASSTASFDCSTGNFFTLVLGAGSNHISASNIRQGQTINVRVTTQTGNSVTCSTAIKQPSGSLYTPTNGAGTDILTFISYDTTLFMVATKTFI
jgi:hypothetical protein